MINKKILPVAIVVLATVSVGALAYNYYINDQEISLTPQVKTETNNKTSEQKNQTENNSVIKPKSKEEINFCLSNNLGIRLSYDKSKWTCVNKDDTNMNSVNELLLVKSNIVITFSDGNRGESCLSCQTEKNIIDNQFVKLTKYYNSNDGQIITYFGQLVNDKNTWVSVSRIPGMENIYGADFTDSELAEIITALSPMAGKN